MLEEVWKWRVGGGGSLRGRVGDWVKNGGDERGSCMALMRCVGWHIAGNCEQVTIVWNFKVYMPLRKQRSLHSIYLQISLPCLPRYTFNKKLN